VKPRGRRGKDLYGVRLTYNGDNPGLVTEHANRGSWYLVKGVKAAKSSIQSLHTPNESYFRGGVKGQNASKGS